MAIDTTGYVDIEEEVKPVTVGSKPALDVSGYVDLEEPDRTYYLSDVDKTVSVPVTMSEEEANTEIGMEVYGKKRNAFLLGVDVVTSAAQGLGTLAVNMGKILPVIGEEAELTAIPKLEERQRKLADEIVRQNELRAKLKKKSDPANNFIQEFIADYKLMKEEDFVNRPFGIDFQKQELVDVSRQLNQRKALLEADQAAVEALEKITSSSFLTPREGSAKIFGTNFTVNQVAFDVGNVGGSLAVSVGSAIYFGNFAVGAALLSGVAKSQVSLEAKEAGVPLEERIKASNKAAASEFLLEYAGTKFIFKGMRGKKSFLRTTVATAVEDLTEVSQFWSETAITNYYGIRETTREQLITDTIYTIVLSTLVAGPTSAMVVRAENNSIIGQLRDAGLNDAEIEDVFNAGKKAVKETDAVTTSANMIKNDMNQIAETVDLERDQGYKYLIGEIDEIPTTLVTETPKFQDGFEAAEYGNDANKLQVRSMELEKIELQKAIDSLRKSGQEAQAKELEQRLAHLNDALEASGPSQDLTIEIGPAQIITTEQAATDLLGFIGDIQKPTLLGEQGDQNRIRTKTGSPQSVQDAGGPKAATKIIEKFLSGKKLTDLQQQKFDAMINEFARATQQRVVDEQQDQKQDQQEGDQQLTELQDQAQNLQEAIDNEQDQQVRQILEDQLELVNEQIQDLQQGTQEDQEQDQEQEEGQVSEERQAELDEVKQRVDERQKEIQEGAKEIEELEKQEVGASKILKKRLKKKKERIAKRLNKIIEKNLREQIKEETKEQRLELKEYIKNRKNQEDQAEFKNQVLEMGSNLRREVALTTDQFFGAVSTRLGNISQELKNRLRKHDFRLQTQINKDAGAVKEYLDGYGKLDSQTKSDLDIALKNGEFGIVADINAQHGLTEAFEKVQAMLNSMYRRAKAVGLDVEYLENFWPRVVADPVKFIEHLRKDDSLWEQIATALQGGSIEFERMTPTEQAHAINTLVRGFKNPKLTLGTPKQLQARIIEVIDSEMNKFYISSPQALSLYISRVNEAIENNKFFGKGAVDDKFKNIEDSIGHFIVKEVADKNLTPREALILEQIIRARFNPGQLGMIVGSIKSIGYLSVLGNPDNALTQIGDLYLALVNGGIYGTLKATGQSLGTSVLKVSEKITGKEAPQLVQLTREDLGIQSLIRELRVGGTPFLQEAVSKVFGATGLKFIDNLGKEAAINATLARYQKLAKNKPNDSEFRRSLDRIFGKEGADVVVADLKDGFISEDVKFLIFNEIADAQPITLSEMPEKYLTSGNGKIFYTLKTFTIKLFDFVRTKSLARIRHGLETGNKAEVVEGSKNFIKILIAYLGTNIGADLLKDLIYDRPITEESLRDDTVNNLLELASFDRYSRYRFSTLGPWSAMMERVTPPVTIIDNVAKDAVFHFQMADHMTFLERLEFSETPQSLPGGDWYYWYFGKGKIKKAEEKIDLEQRAKDRETLKGMTEQERLAFEKKEAEEKIKKKEKKAERLRKRKEKALGKKEKQFEETQNVFDRLR
jgi:hypothetical protein